MNKQTGIFLGLFLILFTMACNHPEPAKIKGDSTEIKSRKGSYQYDALFLRKHMQQVVELYDSSGNSRILLSGDYQGRVMTSTATGDSGNSYGWVNYDLLAAAQKKKQFNPVGGEERFWLGPEGGQFGLYFKKGDSFTIANWQVPAILDTLPFELQRVNNSMAIYRSTASLVNYSGTQFDLQIDRSVELWDRKKIELNLNCSLSRGIHSVAYYSRNTITNIGNNLWKKETGLLSVWLLGMMVPGDQTHVIIPFISKSDSRSLITTNYFGDIPSDRFWIHDSTACFVCDGKMRSKIGISPLISKSMAASFDGRKNILTIIIFPIMPDGEYVNSKWEIQKQPYVGDVMNSYNDGPLPDGSQMGPFYEIESSSPGMVISPGRAQTYGQLTCHFEGSYQDLRGLAQKILGVDLDHILKK